MPANELLVSQVAVVPEAVIRRAYLLQTRTRNARSPSCGGYRGCAGMRRIWQPRTIMRRKLPPGAEAAQLSVNDGNAWQSVSSFYDGAMADRLDHFL